MLNYIKTILDMIKGKQIAGALIVGILLGASFLDCEIIDDIYEAENGHYYRVFSEPVTWDSARINCKKLGGHLVTITSEEESRIVARMFKDTFCWIGAKKDSEGTWNWITGEAFDYTNWSEGEPNDAGSKENVGMMYNNGMWNDMNGEADSVNTNAGKTLDIIYICEWEHKFNIILKLKNPLSFGVF